MPSIRKGFQELKNLVTDAEKFKILEAEEEHSRLMATIQMQEKQISELTENYKKRTNLLAEETVRRQKIEENLKELQEMLKKEKKRRHDTHHSDSEMLSKVVKPNEYQESQSLCQVL